MSKISDMPLQIYRRHSRTCPHRKKGRTYTKCTCTIHAYGELNGKCFRKSTGVRDWQRALRKLAAWESPDTPVLKPVQEAIDNFLKHCHELAPSTRRKYRNAMNHLVAYCDKDAVGTMAEMTVETLDGFRPNRGIGRVTAQKELQTLRQFCAFCVDRKWMSDNLAKRIKPPKNIRPQPIAPYTSEEMEAMLVASDEFGKTSYERLRARAMLLLLRYTGLRISARRLKEAACVTATYCSTRRRRAGLSCCLFLTSSGLLSSGSRRHVAQRSAAGISSGTASPPGAPLLELRSARSRQCSRNLECPRRKPTASGTRWRPTSS